MTDGEYLVNNFTFSDDFVLMRKYIYELKQMLLQLNY